MILNFPNRVTFAPTNIISVILRLSYFPRDWKEAIVCAIPKGGANLAFPSSYRPISLLSGLSKVAERVILKRLNTYLNDNNIIVPEQFGFRLEHSTTHQLIRVIHYVADGVKSKLYVGALFLDVAKAYEMMASYAI